MSAGVSRAFGGGDLLGSKFVRMIFLDESGGAEHDVTVVAGIIIHADSQWDVLERHINELRSEIPPSHDREMILHAVEIYNGSKKTNGVRRIDPEVWERDARHAFLEKLVSIPRQAGVAVVLGFSRGFNELSPRERVKRRHMMAFTQCLVRSNQYIKRFAPGEVASVIAENKRNDREVIDQIKVSMELLRDPVFKEVMMGAIPEQLSAALPVEVIKDTVFFAEKTESPFLQLADACAWSVRRWLARERNDSDRFVRALWGNQDLFREEREAAGFGGVIAPVRFL